LEVSFHDRFLEIIEVVHNSRHGPVKRQFEAHLELIPKTSGAELIQVHLAEMAG
jgi:hypothetical protein